MATVRDCFRQSLKIARAQQARSLALRSAVSLARLPGPAGETGRAPEILRGLYASFTQGFDTPALKDESSRYRTDTR